MSNHMLLIGGSNEIHPKIKNKGFRLSLLFDMATLKKRRNMEIYDRIIGLSSNASNNEWIECAKMIHAIEPFDHIGGFNEATQDIAALIAQQLKLPFHRPEVVSYTRQKNKMRELLREKEIDSTVAALVENAEDIASFGHIYGYPIVLKPVDGRGSLGVSIINTDADIPTAMSWYEKGCSKKQMLVEQFLSGEEFSVEAFSEQGQHRVVCVTQKFKDPKTCIEIGHCLPAPLSEKTSNDIKQFVVRILTAIGVENGPTHTEVIVSNDGPHIVETHVRLAGDSIVELIQLTTGVDLDDAWIRQTSGEKVLNEIPTLCGRYASISFVTPHAVGTLDRIDGKADALAQPGVIKVENIQEIGAHVEGAYDSSSRGAYAIAIGNNAADATSRAKNAAALISFVISCKGA